MTNREVIRIAAERERQHKRLTSAYGKAIRAALNKAMEPLKGADWNKPPELLSQRLDLAKYEELLTRLYSRMIKWDVVFSAGYFSRIKPLKKNDGFGLPTHYNSVLWWQDITRQWMQDYGTEQIRTLALSTREIAAQIIRDTVAGYATSQNGLDLYEIAQAIEKEVLMSWRANSKFRAFTIARTELHAVMNYSSQETVKRFGYTYRKRWVTFMDGRERASHAEANGQVREMQEPFNVGTSLLQYPGEQVGAPEDTINCRCTVVHIPVLPEW